MTNDELAEALRTAASANDVTEDWDAVELTAQSDQGSVFFVLQALADDPLTVPPELKAEVMNWEGWGDEFWYEVDGVRASIESNWVSASPT